MRPPHVAALERFPAMSAGFAGSKSVDDRRRRRLAVESDESKPKRAPAGTAKGKRSLKKSAAERRGTRIPLRKFISKHRWKIWGIGILLLLPVVGLYFGALHLEQVGTKAGPAIARLLDPERATVARAYSGLLLFVSSQLAVVIWWVRSRSPADFGGRFGVWLWAAAACFLFSTCVATDLHLVLAETVMHFRLVHFPQVGPQTTQALCWLVPVGLFGLALSRTLLGDMRRCPSSILTFVLAIACWGGGLFLRMDTKYAVELPNRGLVAAAVILGGSVFLTLSLLLHARFVLYESAAPPAEAAPSQRSSLGAWLASLFRRTESSGSSKSGKGKSSAKKPTKTARKPAAKKPADASDSSDEVETGESEASDEDEEDWSTKSVNASGQNGTKPPEPKAAVKPAAVSTPTRAEPPKPAAPPQKPAVAPPSKPPVQSSQEDEDEDDEEGSDDDSGMDRNALKGLSKRERRRLQKQWRDQQRSGRAA